MIPARLTLAIFIVFQLADGLITYTAVDFFGPHAEANPLVATWIALAGAGPALLGAKLVACGCGLVLYRYGTHKVLAGLTIDLSRGRRRAVAAPVDGAGTIVR